MPSLDEGLTEMEESLNGDPHGVTFAPLPTSMAAAATVAAKHTAHNPSARPEMAKVHSKNTVDKSKVSERSTVIWPIPSNGILATLF